MGEAPKALRPRAKQWLQRRREAKARRAEREARQEQKLADAVERVALTRIASAIAKPLIDAGLVEPACNPVAEAERKRVETLIRRDQQEREHEAARRALLGIEDAARAKLPRETHAQYAARMAETDIARRGRLGPLVTPEAELHGDYRSAEVLHAESNTIAVTKRNRMTSPFEDLWERGAITREQLDASVEIAEVAERITRPVAVKSGALGFRVDNSASARDSLIERLTDVQLQQTYNSWRLQLPAPRGLYVDMLLMPGSLKDKARWYHVGWPKARRELLAALDRWNDIRHRVVREIGEEEVAAAQARLGGGIVL